LGGYLIICEKLELSSVKSAFSSVISRLVALCEIHQDRHPADLMLFDSWSALRRATELDWLDFSDEPSEDSIDMDEHRHYASVANGELHSGRAQQAARLPRADDQFFPLFRLFRFPTF
jgi:hypothetical protein